MGIVWSNKTEIYAPVNDTWTEIAVHLYGSNVGTLPAPSYRTNNHHWQLQQSDHCNL